MKRLHEFIKVIFTPVTILWLGTSVSSLFVDIPNVIWIAFASYYVFAIIIFLTDSFERKGK